MISETKNIFVLMLVALVVLVAKHFSDNLLSRKKFEREAWLADLTSERGLRTVIKPVP
jgi:hypothetical protein